MSKKRVPMRIVFILLISLNLLDAGFFSSDKKLKIVKQMVPMDIAYERGEAFFLLNEIRESMGMNTLSKNDALEAAAQAHADYLVRNGLSSHYETEGMPGFSGVKPADRALQAGYLSTQVSENLSTKNKDAKDSVDGLFSAIYHRFGFLDVGIDEAGVGVAQDAKDPKNNAFVYLMGNSHLNALCSARPFKGYGRYVYGVCKDRNHRISQKTFLKAKNANKMFNPKIIVYPYDGQDGVPPAFYAEEPDPLPDYEVSGFPVSVVFNDYFFKSVKLLSFDLYKDGDKPVTSVRLMTHENDPHHRFTKFQFALFPLERLAYDTEYKAEIVYVAKGKKERKVWHFHTKIPNEPLIRIRDKEAYITVEKGKNYQLYLVPQNGHDMIKTITYPEDVYVRFKDNHTLRLKVPADNDDDFVIKSKHRKIHVEVK